MDRPLEDYLSHFSEVLGEENAPVETLDIPGVPDAHFPPISVIREGVCFHRHHPYPERPDEGILSVITVREPGTFLAGERG